MRVAAGSVQLPPSRGDHCWEGVPDDRLEEHNLAMESLSDVHRINRHSRFDQLLLPSSSVILLCLSRSTCRLSPRNEMVSKPFEALNHVVRIRRVHRQVDLQDHWSDLRPGLSAIGGLEEE